MRAVKLIFIFILIVGNIVLLLNVSDLFGSKRYTPEELSETNKEALFAEMLKNKINDDKEFFNTEDVKLIVEKYNKLNQPVLPDSTKVKEANTDVNGGVRIDGSHVKEIVTSSDNEVLRNAIQKSKKQNGQNRDQIKAEILELVKKKDLKGCMMHSGWKKGLNQTEKNTVDYLLRTDQYKMGKAYKAGNEIKKYTNAQYHKIMNYINNLDFGQFQSWEDLENAKEYIIKIRELTEK